MKVSEILRAASETWDVPVAAFLSARKTKELTRRRHVVMWAATRYTLHSLPQIGAAIGGRDHTTILHGRNKIERELGEKDPETCALVSELMNRLYDDEIVEPNEMSEPDKLESMRLALIETRERLRREKERADLAEQAADDLQKALDAERNRRFRLEVEAAAPKESPQKVRKCLSCGVDFLSDGPGHRNCGSPSCSDRRQNWSHTDGMAA